MKVVKPKPLRAGDVVVTVSPSWGGPGTFPHIYQEGVRVLKEVFGLRVEEFPTARMDAGDLYRNPHRCAQDLNAAFADPDIQAIFTTIGGDDSVRILPFLDREVALANPKVLMGFSDTTTLLTFYNRGGLVTFHGPSIMAGFAQIRNSPTGFATHIKDMLFRHINRYVYRPYEEWYEGYPDWRDPKNTGKIMQLHQNEGWQWIQGTSCVRGQLFGGCIEVLEFLKGTRFWPEESFWERKILFLETSEDVPTPLQVKWMLRNYGMQGVFGRIRALLFGRPRGYTTEQKQQLNEALLAVVGAEFGASNLPIVANMDFGHTDPQWILPLGIEAEIDCENRAFRLADSPTAHDTES